MCSVISIRWWFIKGKKRNALHRCRNCRPAVTAYGHFGQLHWSPGVWSRSGTKAGILSRLGNTRILGANETRCLDFQRKGIYSVTRPYCADSAYVLAESLRHQALSAEHCVDSVFLHQLVVSALFHHLSLIQNVDSIGISHG